MPSGIVLFGANGSGKTTLGRKLARVLQVKHIDVEDYYFEKSKIPYTKSRDKDTVIKLILDDIHRHGSFVLSSVIGDLGDEITSMYRLAVFLWAPIDTRLDRVKRRSQKRYGERVLAGGDMYEQEQRFIEFVRTRDLSKIDDWAKTLTCPIIKLDGTNPISENIDYIAKQYNGTVLLGR